MALLPEAVDKSRISEDEWYSRSAREASIELGIKGRDRILAHLRQALGVERATTRVLAIDFAPKRQLKSRNLR